MDRKGFTYMQFPNHILMILKGLYNKYMNNQTETIPFPVYKAEQIDNSHFSEGTFWSLHMII